MTKQLVAVFSTDFIFCLMYEKVLLKLLNRLSELLNQQTQYCVEYHIFQLLKIFNLRLQWHIKPYQTENKWLFNWLDFFILAFSHFQWKAVQKCIFLPHNMAPLYSITITMLYVLCLASVDALFSQIFSDEICPASQRFICTNFDIWCVGSKDI